MFKYGFKVIYYYIIESIYPVAFKKTIPQPEVKWILQEADYTPLSTDIFNWEEFLIDSYWDDNKQWFENTII